ncbi:DUF4352 domain-containing protein [Streptomyces sp. NPDC056488]|uniref:DUF4352 domain-containing protein n=1 Tax=Streptomyces sp. NPDC056488 TaxID=3345836 RepID=UPI0036AE5B50
MSQPQYGPPQPPQTGWGQPGPYGPPPPKKGLGAGAIIAIVVGSVLGLFILIGIIGAALGDDTSSETSGKAPSKSAAPAPEKSSAPAAAPKTQAPKEEPADKPVVVAATTTSFKPSILHDGGQYTSVKVTVTNRGDEEIDINPLYFTITDTGGSKHTAELGVDTGQIDTVKLAPGENVSGTITGEGKFTPKYVTYTDGMFGDGIRGDVK